MAAAPRALRAVAQASGVATERDGISGEEAFTVLRRYPQCSGTPLRERAEEVAASSEVPSSRESRPDHGSGPDG
jgi:AmiR/NasT family two-component response regulator